MIIQFKIHVYQILILLLLGNPRRHITTLQSLTDQICHGEPSLQNSLELAYQTLRWVTKFYKCHPMINHSV